MPPLPRLVPAVILAVALPAAAQVPRLLGYQGRLLRADGTAATGTASVGFAIFPVDTGGSALWSETQTLGLSDGYYSTMLGLVAPAPDSLFDGGGRWLEVRVGAETLSPRQQIGSVPFAMVARGVVGTADVSSLKISGQTVIDADGRLSTGARYGAGAGLAVDDAARTYALQACAAGQALVRDATAWRCETAGTVTRVSAVEPLAVADGSAEPSVSLPRAGTSSSGYLASGDWTAFNSKFGAATQCGGDLSGPLSAPTVVRLQSRPMASAAPSAGQVLKWNGAQWEPAPDADAGGTVTVVTGIAPLTVWYGSSTPQISIDAATSGRDGYLASADFSGFSAKFDASTQCGGDLSGALSAPLVTKLQGVAVASAVPGAAQVLRFDGARWAPASLGVADVGGISSGYLDLTGSQTVSGAKSFSSAPSFGTPLAVASGGIGTATAGANQFFAGPSGSAGTPGFRALDATDLPPLDAGAIATGTLGTARGGTGAASFAAGGVLYGNGASAVGASAGNAGEILVSGGSGAPAWTSSPALAGTNFSSIPESAVTGLSAALTARPTGTGSSGALARWSGTSALAGSTVLYDDGGRVGIGTSNPTDTLTVNVANGVRYYADGTYNMGIRTGFNTTNNVTSISFRDRTDTAYQDVYMEAKSWRFTYNGNASTGLVLDSAGRVGIGTTPAAALQLGQGSTIAIAGAGANNSTVGFLKFGTDATAGRWGGIQSFRGGDAATIDLRFFTMQGDTEGVSERMRITHNGLVGIGTTNPQDRLDLGDGFLRVQRYGGIGLVSDTTSGSVRGLRIRPDAGYAPNVVEFGGWNFSTGAATAIHTVFTGGGNVGIGVTSPGVKLDVAGQIRATDTIQTVKGTANVWLGYNDGTKDFGLYQWQAAGTAPANYLQNNLGIGTTNPTAKLQVAGDIVADGGIRWGNLRMKVFASSGAWTNLESSVCAANGYPYMCNWFPVLMYMYMNPDYNDGYWHAFVRTPSMADGSMYLYGVNSDWWGRLSSNPVCTAGNAWAIEDAGGNNLAHPYPNFACRPRSESGASNVGVWCCK